MTANFIADSFTRADAALDEIVAEVSRLITEGEKAKANITKVSVGLSQLGAAYPNGYLESVQFIKKTVAANRDDAAWKALDNRLDKVVGDFQVARARFEAMVAALAGK